MKQLLFLGLGLVVCQAQAQLVVQNGATLFVDAGATVTVQGDLTSNANITGTGKIVMKGTGLQNLNMNGFTIPNLDIDNVNHVALTGAATVTGVLNFVNGKLQLGNNHFTLGSAGSFAGTPGPNKFAETNGEGEFRKQVTAVGSVVLPVGSGSDYTPVTFQMAGNTFSNGLVGAIAKNSGHPNKHPRSTDFLNTYWSLSRSGISGGTVNAEASYIDPSDVTGVESDMVAMTFAGGNWAISGTLNSGSNLVTVPVAGASADAYAMNKFVLLNSKVYLHGPFDGTTALMRDGLRTNNLIPLSDPYRTATYNVAFPAVNNPVVETISASVLNNQASDGDNIVDWVFLELKNELSPFATNQTRSALVTKSGKVVDVDGVSPIYFKNVDAGNFNVLIRHRNHLGVSNNAVVPLTLSATNTDFTASLAPAYDDPAITTNDALRSMPVGVNPAVFGLFSGNGNGDRFARNTGGTTTNDYSILLSNLTTTLGYYRNDYNMDGRVQITGGTATNDYSRFLNSLNGLNIVTQHNK